MRDSILGLLFGKQSFLTLLHLYVLLLNSLPKLETLCLTILLVLRVPNLMSQEHFNLSQLTRRYLSMMLSYNCHYPLNIFDENVIPSYYNLIFPLLYLLTTLILTSILLFNQIKLRSTSSPSFSFAKSFLDT